MTLSSFAICLIDIRPVRLHQSGCPAALHHPSPAFPNRVADLEKEMGITIFYRKHRA